MTDRKYASVLELREAIRSGQFTSQTSGVAGDRVQANLAIMPKEFAFDFLLFAMRNPKQVPIVDVLEAGQIESKLAPGSDIRTDVPEYNIFKDGELVDTRTDITEYWQDDFVSFLIGCSFSFESSILDAGIPIKHIEEGNNVAMYKTDIPNVPAGPFASNMVVSMRSFDPDNVQKVTDITAQFPNMHGAPVHAGNPEEIGISDISQPDYGEFTPFDDDQVPVFWGCGVTPQNVALEAKLPIMITHVGGKMFVTDVNNDEFMEANKA